MGYQHPEVAENLRGQLRGTRLQRLRQEGSSIKKVRSFKDNALKSKLYTNEPESGEAIF